MVYGMTLEGEVESFFESPINSASVITWDSDREILWIGGRVIDPLGVDRDGNQIDGMEVDRGGLRIYALAYFAGDPDNTPLYIFNYDSNTNRQMLHKHSFETNENIFLTYLDSEAGGYPSGAYITNEFDGINFVFMSMADNGAEDRLDIWQLHSDTDWMAVDPVSGTVNPEEGQVISLSIDATELRQIEYPIELVFNHNGFEPQTVIIPIYIAVVHPDNVSVEKDGLPHKYEISSVYPNPFNSTVSVRYTVPIIATVSMKIYDILGALIDELASGIHISGRHEIAWNASAMPSGIYIVRMEAEGISHTMKLILMK